MEANFLRAEGIIYFCVGLSIGIYILSVGLSMGIEKVWKTINEQLEPAKEDEKD